MESIKLTKTKADNIIIGGISRVIKACTFIVLKGDCMHSVIEADDIGSTLKKNGTTIVKSFIGLELPDGVVMRSVYGLENTISDIRKRVKASKEIFMMYDTSNIGLSLDGDYVGLFVEDNPDNYNRKWNNYNDALNYIMDTQYELDLQQRMDIANSKVVEVGVNESKVRLSKNCIPLIGPVRADAEPKFRLWYNIRNANVYDGTGVLCLHVDYGNDTNAIHLYSVILY